MIKNNYPDLTDSSASVQTHLEILQNVIQRMSSNSTQCKTWCITIVSAILVIVADSGEPNYAWIALFPSFLFLGLDSYYLSLEKGFRKSYKRFVKKIHAHTLEPNDLYSISPSGKMGKHIWKSFLSFSIWGYYLGLIILVIILRFFILI